MTGERGDLGLLSSEVQFWGVQSWAGGVGYRGAGSEGVGVQNTGVQTTSAGCGGAEHRGLGLGDAVYWVHGAGCRGARAGGAKHMGARLRVPKESPHADTIQGLPEAPMEKDVDSCQDGAKTVPSTGLGTEGTETQVRAGGQAWRGTRPVVAIPKS